jgi:hypothetical protein
MKFADRFSQAQNFGDINEDDDKSMMGKQKPEKPTNIGSDSMLRLKAPIHRIAANSITKNAPVKKDLFKVPLPVTAVRLQPNLIGDFVKTYGSK